MYSKCSSFSEIWFSGTETKVLLKPCQRLCLNDVTYWQQNGCGQLAVHAGRCGGLLAYLSGTYALPP